MKNMYQTYYSIQVRFIRKTLVLILFLLCLLVAAFEGAAQGEFITTWKTDNPGTSMDNQITIPTTGSGYNYTVDWGDGNSDAGVIGDITHTYASAGTYTVEITGDFPRIFFSFGGDKDKILTIEQWGNIAWVSMERAFAGCTNLTSTASDAPDLSSVTSLDRTFSSCSNFNGPIGNWDTSNIDEMRMTFSNAPLFNQNISGWNTQNVTIMQSMFSGASAFNADISGWNTTNVEFMHSMFQNASSFNQDISSWNTGNVRFINSMFEGASSFNQDIGGWNVTNATVMQEMFLNATSFNQDLSNWSIGSVTNMSQIFDGSSLSTLNYDKILEGWAAQTVQSNVTLGASGIEYCLGASARAILTDAGGPNWTITDGGENCAIDFPDTNFKSALLANTSINTVDDGEITIQEAEAFFGTIQVNSSTEGVVTDLTGIEAFINLQVLTMINHDITEFDATNHPNLRNLILSTNELTEIDITSNPLLTFVNLNNNQISEIDVSSNTNLSDLKISNNELSTIDVSMLPLLTQLTVDRNNLSEVDITNNADLVIFDAFDNNINSFDISQNPDIRYMNLSTTGISSIDVSHMTQLEELNLSFTQVSNLDLSTNTLLEQLRVIDTQLTSLDLSNNSALRVLLAQDNNLSALNIKNDNNGAISSFNATNNPLLTCIEVDDAAAAETNFTNVDAGVFFAENSCPVYIPDANFKAALLANPAINTTDDGEITYAEAEAFDGVLNVVNLEISDATGIEAFINIDELNISINNLTSLDVSNNTKLTSLRIGANQISGINLSQNTMLDDLITSDCPLTELDVTNNPLLKNITISNNLISGLDLSNNTALTGVDVYDQPNLVSIDLRNSNNEDITSINLSSNPSLTCVSVDDRVLARNNWTNVDDIDVYKFTCDAEEIVNIPDANFKAVLLANTEINTTDDGEITYGEAEAFTGTINAVDQSISSFIGLEAFSNVSRFEAGQNNATVIDFSNNAELLQIRIGNVPINFLDVSNNTKLELLEFGALSTLASVDVSNNPELFSLTTGGASSLTEIVGIENLTKLRFAYLFNCALESLDLSNAVELTQLRAQNNNLTSLDLRNGNNEGIVLFEIANNDLTCVSVDDPIYSIENWTSIDPEVEFNFSCDPNDIVNIPDANFKAALLADATINTTDDGEITYGEAEAFTGEIDVQNLAITDLTGIEAFSHITQLDINRNDLTSVDLRYNSALTHLFAYSNSFESIDLSYNTSITNLNLNSNALGTLDISNQPNLFTLQCQSCELSSLDVSSNPDIQFLLINNNSISTIDVSGNLALHTLNIHNNQISSLDVSSNSNLQSLSAFGNAISSIDVSNNGSLGFLSMSNNPLTAIDVSNNGMLTYLAVSNCSITELDVSGNSSLTRLFAINNELTALNSANGNNVSFTDFQATGNASLTCITVDDVAFAETNFSNIDEGASFSTNCNNVETDFLTFSFAEQLGDATINATNHTINIEVVFDTDLTNLVPTFTLSSGATSDEASGVAQDFSALFTYTVTAENPNVTQEWTVTVLEENVDPTDLSLSVSSIEENNAVNDAIGSFTTVDENDADSHSYTLVEGDGDTDNASFNISGSNLRASESFDFETKDSYSVRVQTSDGRGGIFEKAFTISVTDIVAVVNELSLDNSTIDENQAVGTTIGTFSSAGDDLTGNLTYSLVAGEGDTDNASFAITNDVLGNASIFNFESKDSYSIRVNVSDEAGTSLDQVFAIMVTNANDAPTAIALSNESIDENNVLDEVVGILSTEDEDSGETYTYSLVSGEGDDDNAAFNIVDDELLAASVFDFEAQNSFSVRIETNDGNGGTFEQVFTISIDDQNESIIISNPIADLTVNERFGSEEIDLTDVFTDQDGDVLTYTVSSSETDIVTVANTDAVLTISETGIGTSTITVTADDGSGVTTSDEFIVTVVNINDAPIVVNPLSDQNDVVEGFGSAQFNYADVFEDPDGDELTITVSSSDETVVTVQVIANNQIQVDEVGIGTSMITLTADDGNGGSISDTFSFTVNEIPNSAPIVINPLTDQTAIIEGFGSAQFNYSDVFEDPDGDELTITVNSSDENVVTATVIANNQIQVDEVGIGTSTITLTANDGNGGTISDEFIFTVNEAPNNAPIVINPLSDQTAVVEGFGAAQFNYTNVFEDPDGDEITITVSSSDETVVTAQVIANNQIQVDEVGIGTSTITLTADDGNGGTVSDEFIFTVSERPLGLGNEVDVQVYPNPVTNYLNVKAQSEIEVILFDLDGKRIKSAKGNQLLFDLTGLNSGAYLLKIMDENTVTDRRIIKAN